MRSFPSVGASGCGHAWPVRIEARIEVQSGNTREVLQSAAAALGDLQAAGQANVNQVAVQDRIASPTPKGQARQTTIRRQSPSSRTSYAQALRDGATTGCRPVASMLARQVMTRPPPSAVLVNGNCIFMSRRHQPLQRMRREGRRRCRPGRGPDRKFQLR